MFLPVYGQKSSAVTHANELYQALVGSDLTDYTNDHHSQSFIKNWLKDETEKRKIQNIYSV